MTELHPTHIEGKVTLSDGSVTSFHITPEYGWQQWGNITEKLAVTGGLMDAFVDAAHEHGISEVSEDDEEESHVDKPTYLIRRFYQNDRHPDNRTVVETGLTREEAKAHCTSDVSRGRDEDGNVIWFDGFEEE